MSFFISEAYAEAAPGIQPGLEGIIFPLGVLLFFLFSVFTSPGKTQQGTETDACGFDQRRGSGYHRWNTG